MQNSLQDCLIAFGSNVGDSEAIFLSLIELLRDQTDIASVTGSDLVRTEPIGGPAGQREYLNGCLRIETSMGCKVLFLLLRKLEDDLGRERRQRWGARRVDLDLLLYGDSSIELHDPSLLVPHPRMSFRRFVLEPANQIASEMVHARSGITIGRLLERLDELPDHVALVVSEEIANKYDSVMKAVETICLENGFTFVLGGEELLQEEASQSKLLLCCAEEDSSLLSQCLSFSGANLKLPAANPSVLTKELSAALCAMQPLKR